MEASTGQPNLAEQLLGNPDANLLSAMENAQVNSESSGSTFRQDIYLDDGSVVIVRSVQGESATLQAVGSVTEAEATQ